MKQQNIKILLALLISMLGTKASAHDIAIPNADGVNIYYLYINNKTELAVSYRGGYSSSYSNEYSGNVVIPESVTYNETTYSVTSIGNGAFQYCSGLTSITIPNSVTSIGSSAFQYCSGLTSVTIGNSVTSIGELAFRDCSGLTELHISDLEAWCNVRFKGSLPFSCLHHLYLNGEEVKNLVIPNSVTIIGDYAFYQCSGLTSVTIPNSVTSIGESAFYECSGLTSVTIPNSVTSIGYGAFYGTAWYDNQPDGLVYAGKVAYTYKGTMPSNTNIVLEEGTLGIANSAFYECSVLMSVTIPNSVTVIGNSAFYKCSGLTSITIPNSVTSIGSSAFYECSGLTSVTIPNSVTNIGGAAFRECSGLTSITIPNSVTSIGYGAFYGTAWYDNQPDGLVYAGKVAYTYKGTMPLNTNIVLEEGTLSISPSAFSRRTDLTSVTIPNSVTSIGELAFRGCFGLTSVTIGNSVTSIGEWAFSGCSSLTSITISNSVTSIGSSAFDGCSGLTSIIIGNGIKTIDGNAFAQCSELTNVYCYAETVPSTDASAFNDSYIEHATLHVPESAIENYKATATWSNFKNFVSVTDDNNYYDLSITVTNALGKVTYGTTEIMDGQQTFDVKEGSDVVLRLTPNDGYRVATVTVNDEDKTAEVVDGQLTISNVTANVVVNVRFITAGETASVSIGSTGMATLCSTKDLDFTEVSGLKAYTGAGFNRMTGALTMLEVKDAPAGTGLVLIGGEGTYDIPVKPSASVYGNLLVGVTEDTQLTQTAEGYTNYILGNGDNGLGFYIVTTEGGTLAAGKAYLRLPTVTANARRVISIEYGEGVTGVDNRRMTPAESDGSYYTLSGQRMTGTPGKAGVYIKGGHKVIIK